MVFRLFISKDAYEHKHSVVDYFITTPMEFNTDMLPSEKELAESLSPEQLVLVAKWLLDEKDLRTEEGYHSHVSESLEAMARGLRNIAQIQSTGRN